MAPIFSRGTSFVYNLLYVVMIYFFCYFWTAITFNPKEMSENLKDYGTFIPGYRPGKRTADYLETIGRAFQILSPEEMHERYPHLVPDDVRWALFDPQGGVLLADRIIRALHERLDRRGVLFRTQTRVESIDPNRRTLQLAGGD